MATVDSFEPNDTARRIVFLTWRSKDHLGPHTSPVQQEVTPGFANRSTDYPFLEFKMTEDQGNDVIWKQVNLVHYPFVQLPNARLKIQRSKQYILAGGSDSFMRERKNRTHRCDKRTSQNE